MKLISLSHKIINLTLRQITKGKFLLVNLFNKGYQNIKMYIKIQQTQQIK